MQRRPLIPLLALATIAPWWPAAVHAQARKPLLIEGKKTIYKKVLTRPGAASGRQTSSAFMAGPAALADGARNEQQRPKIRGRKASSLPARLSPLKSVSKPPELGRGG